MQTEPVRSRCRKPWPSREQYPNRLSSATVSENRRAARQHRTVQRNRKAEIAVSALDNFSREGETRMILVDAHLDLSLNALNWNRDLTRPVDEIRASERGMAGPGPGRGANTVC